MRDIAIYKTHRVVQFMSSSSNQKPQRRHLLRLDQLSLGIFQIAVGFTQLVVHSLYLFHSRNVPENTHSTHDLAHMIPKQSQVYIYGDLSAASST